MKCKCASIYYKESSFEKSDKGKLNIVTLMREYIPAKFEEVYGHPLVDANGMFQVAGEAVSWDQLSVRTGLWFFEKSPWAFENPETLG